VSILNALNPQFSATPSNVDLTRSLLRDDDTVVYAPSEGSIREEKKERGGFWSWANPTDRDNHRRDIREKEDGQQDLMRIIGIFAPGLLSLSPFRFSILCPNRVLDCHLVRGLGRRLGRLRTSISDRSERQGSGEGSSERIQVRIPTNFSPRSSSI
jgi:hypothetical protein